MKPDGPSEELGEVEMELGMDKKDDTDRAGTAHTAEKVHRDPCAMHLPFVCVQHAQSNLRMQPHWNRLAYNQREREQLQLCDVFQDMLMSKTHRDASSHAFDTT
jgi:hypothetical protein